MRHTLHWTAVLAVLCAASTLSAKQQVLLNGSMENGPGPFGFVQTKAQDWTFFNGGERSPYANYAPAGTGHAFRAFGSDTTVGAYQDVPVAPGEVVVVSASLFTLQGDKIGGDAQAGLKLEWVDPNQTTFGAQELFVLDANSPYATWIPVTINGGAAPINTVAARITLVFVDTVNPVGSAFWDDASLTVNGGANELLNGDFEQPLQLAEYDASDIDQWLGFGTQKKSNDHALDGQYSVRLVASTNPVCDYCGNYQDATSVVAGDHIYFQSRVFSPTVGGLTGGAAAGLKLEFRPPEGIVAPPAEQNLAFTSSTPVDTWVQVTLTTTVPANIDTANVVLINDGHGDPNVNGPVYIDDATVTRNGNAVSLLNPSFEVASPLGWVKFQNTDCLATRVSTVARTGSFSMRIATGCTGGVYQSISVATGDQISIGAWFRHRAAAPYNDPNSRAGVKIEWSIGGLPEPPNHWIDIGGTTNTILATHPHDQWLPVYIDYTMPAATSASLRCTNIIARSGEVSVNAYFDNDEAVVLNRFNGADVDNDNDEDLVDFAWLQRTFTGPGGPMKYLGLAFDNDPNPTGLGDNDVDAADWAYFAARMTSPN